MTVAKHIHCDTTGNINILAVILILQAAALTTYRDSSAACPFFQHPGYLGMNVAVLLLGNLTAKVSRALVFYDLAHAVIGGNALYVFT